MGGESNTPHAGGLVRVVTDAPGSVFVRRLVAALARRGVQASVGRTVTAGVPAFAWAVTPPRLRRVARDARRLQQPLLNGSIRIGWPAIKRLIVRGVPVPRTVPAAHLAHPQRLARDLGLPLVLRAPDTGVPPQLVSTEPMLGDRLDRRPFSMVQEYVWTASDVCRVSVVDGRARGATELRARDGFRASTGHAHERPLPSVDTSCAHLAERACAVLGCRVAVVTIARAPQGLVVIGVASRAPLVTGAALMALADWLATAAATSPETIAREADALDRRRPAGPTATRRAARRQRLQIAITCPDPRVRRPVWLWCALAEAFRRQGHTLVTPRSPGDMPPLEDSDFVLMDPGRTLRASGHAGEQANMLWDRCRERGHCVKRVENGRLVSVTSKIACVQMLEALQLPSPPTYCREIPDDAPFPLVAKPAMGSCGRGLRMLPTPAALRRFTRRGHVPGGYVVQPWIDGHVNHSVSFRIVTVATRIVAAALFYGERGRPSNLNRGGRAIPFSGVHGGSPIDYEADALLDRLGVSGATREVPPVLADAARRAGTWLSARGVQIAGHDFIPDGRGGWLYLEANAYPGYLIFAATDGDRRKRLLSGYYRAASIIASAIGDAFAG